MIYPTIHLAHDKYRIICLILHFRFDNTGKRTAKLNTKRGDFNFPINISVHGLRYNCNGCPIIVHHQRTVVFIEAPVARICKTKHKYLFRNSLVKCLKQVVKYMNVRSKQYTVLK